MWLRINTEYHQYKRASHRPVQGFAEKEEGFDKEESSCSDENSSVCEETQDWFDGKCGSCRHYARGGF